MRTNPAPTPSKTRRLASAVGLGLALSVTAPIVAAPVAGASTPAVPVDRTEYGSKIHGSIRVGDDVSLDLRKVSLTGTTSETGTGTGLPQHIAASHSGGSENFFYYASDWATEAAITFDYAIDDGAYVLHGTVDVPTLENKSMSAEIRRTGLSTRDDRSPYTVSVHWADPGERYNPQPAFEITRKPTEVVTDKGRQAEILQKEKASGYDPVTFATTGNLERVTGPYHQVSRSVSNTLPDDAEYAVAWANTTKVEDNLGGSIKAEAQLLHFLKASAEIEYDHTWSTEEKFSETATMSIETGHRAAWYYADAWDRVHGDLTISTRDKVYVLKDTSVDFPSRYGDLRAQDLGRIDGGGEEG